MLRKIVFFSDYSISIFDVDDLPSERLDGLVEWICLLRRTSVLSSYTLDESSFFRWFHDVIASCSYCSGEEV